MDVGSGAFGPALIAWTDASASDLDPRGVLRRFGPDQITRHAGMDAFRARRFVAGRLLLTRLIDQLTDASAWGFTSTCERCGSPEHGRPRLEGAPVAVSVSYAGSVVVAVAANRSDADAVGVDAERVSGGGSNERLGTLRRLFAPGPPPDLAGWTLLEAALKADGRGLGVDVADVRVGDPGTGRWPLSRAIRVPGRDDAIDAAVIPGPTGFVLSVATSGARQD